MSACYKCAMTHDPTLSCESPFLAHNKPFDKQVTVSLSELVQPETQLDAGVIVENVARYMAKDQLRYSPWRKWYHHMEQVLKVLSPQYCRPEHMAALTYRNSFGVDTWQSCCDKELKKQIATIATHTKIDAKQMLVQLGMIPHHGAKSTPKFTFYSAVYDNPPAMPFGEAQSDIERVGLACTWGRHGLPGWRICAGYDPEVYGDVLADYVQDHEWQYKCVAAAVDDAIKTANGDEALAFSNYLFGWKVERPTGYGLQLAGITNGIRLVISQEAQSAQPV